MQVRLWDQPPPASNIATIFIHTINQHVGCFLMFGDNWRTYHVNSWWMWHLPLSHRNTWQSTQRVRPRLLLPLYIAVEQTVQHVSFLQKRVSPHSQQHDRPDTFHSNSSTNNNNRSHQRQHQPVCGQKRQRPIITAGPPTRPLLGTAKVPCGAWSPTIQLGSTVGSTARIHSAGTQAVFFLLLHFFNNSTPRPHPTEHGST